MANRFFKNTAIIILLSSVFSVAAQIPKGTWRDHLPYNQGHRLALTPNRVYCATNLALFYYDKTDGYLIKRSKINGLSDLGIGDIAYSEKYDKLLIGYSNGNIDLFTGDDKTNFPDIKMKNMVADKSIYHINIIDDFAYLSCGFGMVVFNLAKNEISDSYIIGPGGSYMKITGSAIFNDSIYATTEHGIYCAAVNDPFLGNYQQWKKIENISNPEDHFSSPVLFDNKLYTIDNTGLNDSTLILENNGYSWDTVLTHLNEVKNLAVSQGKLTVAKRFHVLTYGPGLEELDIYSDHNAQHCLWDKEGNLWIADSKEGLIRKTANIYKTAYMPEGPNSNFVYDISYNHGAILVAPGGHKRTGEPSYIAADLYEFKSEFWSSLLQLNHDFLLYLRDVVYASGTNSDNYMVGTYGSGVIQVVDNQVTKVWNKSNTNGVLGNFVSGCTYDHDGNFWALNRMAERPFVVRTPQGNWFNYAYNSAYSNNQNHKIICTRRNDLWAISLQGNGIFVWNANGTPENGADDDYNHFEVCDENGPLSGEVYDIAEDQEGAIWLGTADGVVVYDNPERVFSSSTPYGRVPQLVVDGYLKNLLEGEVVSSIAVDGANRKWLATLGGGLFLVSADGTEQIMVWNEDNSKLLSNNINAVEINQKTGEVFIGTDKGLQSFMGTSTGSYNDFSRIYAFPNPVKDGYDGIITIRGLMYESNVKITDLAGHLVYETMSNGGDAVWNGKDLGGTLVNPGIYLVLCTTPTGEQAEATKILIVR